MVEEKRISCRRRRKRRMSAMLEGSISEEERQQYDRLFGGRHITQDRRKHQRRAGDDRRDRSEG